MRRYASIWQGEGSAMSKTSMQPGSATRRAFNGGPAGRNVPEAGGCRLVCRLRGATPFTLALMLSAGCASQAVQPQSEQRASRADDLLIVDCLLPGQVRKLGRRLTYLAPRRAVKTAATDCEIRGGEYVAYDRANYATALKVWLPQAQEGDPQAQTYVGEIYEKGLDIAPDYEVAALWYRKAAEQGDSRAQINLGYMYEKGLGVDPDVVEALNWYRRASGLSGGELEYASSVALAARQAQRRELDRLRAAEAEQRREVEALQAQLAQTQQTLSTRREQLEYSRREVAQMRQQLAATPKPGATATGAVAAGDVARLETELRESRSERQALQARIEQQKQDTAVLRQHLDQVRAELEQRKAGIQRAEAELARNRAAIEAERAAATADREEMRRLDEIARKRAATLAAQQKRVEELEAELQHASQAGGEQQAIANRVADAEAERDALREELAKKQQEVARLTAELDRQNLELEQRREALQAAQEALAKARADLGLQQAATNRDQTVIDLLNAEVNRQERVVQVQQEEMRWLEKEIEEQRQQLETALAAAKARQRELQSALSERDTLVKTLQEELAAAEERLADSLEELAVREQELADERRRAQLERQQLEQRQQIVAVQAETQRAQLEKELQRREARIRQQQAEIEQLQQRVSQERSRLAALEGANEDAEPAPAIEIIEPPLVYTRGGPATVNLRFQVGTIEVIGRVDPADELLSFRVNDQPASVDTSGLFTARVAVENADTPVNVVAVDKGGNRTAVDFVLVPAEGEAAAQVRAAAPKAPIGIDFGRYFALVIGNERYQSFPDLSTPRNDARAVASLLRDRYGFDVQLLLDADRYSILSALNELRESLTPDDNLLIYYAGHGEIDERGGRGHWLPVDAEPNNDATWLSNSTITDILSVMPARHVLVVADSCYSGSMTRTSVARLPEGMPEAARVKWYRAMTRIRARTALTSGGVRPVLDTGGGEHSIFARAFLEALRSNKEVLDGFGLYWAVQQNVRRSALALRSDQIPQYAPLQYAGHECGEFFFLPASLAVQTPGEAEARWRLTRRVPEGDHVTG